MIMRADQNICQYSLWVCNSAAKRCF